ncbi:hypothetical protein JCM11251_005049 [Rhodosporidiobolus azoricus]
MESVFAEYETDLETVLSAVADKLGGEALTLRGDDRRAMFRRVERELEEADEIIAQMEVEVQTADKDKAELQGKLRDHKATVARHKGDLNSLASNANRDDLLNPSSRVDHVSIPMGDLDRSESPSSASASQAQRTRLLSATDKLADGQRRLEDSHRMALETEDVGTNILRDLRTQRDTLEHTRDTLYDADSSIDRASNTLKKMIRRAYQQRAVTYAIIAVLVLLIVYVLISKLFG